MFEVGQMDGKPDDTHRLWAAWHTASCCQDQGMLAGLFHPVVPQVGISTNKTG